MDAGGISIADVGDVGGDVVFAEVSAGVDVLGADGEGEEVGAGDGLNDGRIGRGGDAVDFVSWAVELGLGFCADKSDGDEEQEDAETVGFRFHDGWRGWMICAAEDFMWAGGRM